MLSWIHFNNNKPQLGPTQPQGGAWLAYHVFIRNNHINQSKQQLNSTLLNKRFQNLYNCMTFNV